MTNYILYCSGSTGDVLPFVRVGMALRKLGHDVLLLAHASYAQLAERAGLRYQPYDTDCEYQALLHQAALLNTPKTIPEFLSRYSLPKTPRVIALIEAHADADTVVVTPPLFDTATRIAAEKFGLPLVWLFLAPVQVAARQLKTVLFERMLGEQVNRWRANFGLKPVDDWPTWLDYGPSLGLWPDWFATAEAHWPAGLFAAGFPIGGAAEQRPLPSAVAEFLAAHPKPILVTGGTGAFMGEQFYQAALGAMAELAQPSIVVTPYEQLLPTTLPTNCQHWAKLPFDQLLPSTAAVVHHGGIGTIAAAARAAVPQLVLAFGADRPDNGRRLSQLGIGAVEPPPRWQPDRLAQQLAALTNSTTVASRCATIAQRMTDNDGAAAAAAHLHQLHCG